MSKKSDNPRLRLVELARALDENRRGGLGPTDDGCVSTEQLDDELFSDAERLELQRVQRALAFINNAKDPLNNEALRDTPALAGETTRNTATGDFAAVKESELPPDVGRFELKRLLGQGGFAKVWLAYDPTLDRQVAIKLLRTSQFFSEEVHARFEREAKAAAVLSHPNIVPVFETGAIGNERFLVAGYCEGTTLENWIKEQNGQVDLKTAAEIVAKLAEAVEHAHQRGIIHRDLKPANILLEDQDPNAPTNVSDRLRITDFGLAKQLESTNQVQTAEGAIIGTPAYMAPEQASGSNSVDHRIDIYSLGVILYELLTGQVPHRRDTHVETLLAIGNDQIQRPRKYNRLIARDLEAVCLKCIKKESSQRYANSHELSQDLHAWLNGEVVSARRVSQVERFGKWCARNSVLTGGLIFVTAALGIAIWQWTASQRNLAIAESETTRAQSYLDRMTGIVDGFLSDIEQTEEATLITAAQRRQLDEILDLQRSLIEEQEKDTALKLNTMRAFERICRIHSALGEVDKALAAHQEARSWIGTTSRLFAQTQEHDQNKDILQLALDLHIDEAEILDKEDRGDESLVLLEWADNTLEEYSDLFSGDEKLRYLVIIRNRQGLAYRTIDRFDEALAFFSEAAVFSEELLKNTPSLDLDVAIPTAACWINLASSYKKNQELETALAYSLRAQNFIESSLGRYPKNIPLLRLKGTCLSNQASYLKQLRKPAADIVFVFDETVSTWKNLMSIAPQNPNYKISLAGALTSQCGFLRRAGEIDEALGVSDQFMILLEEDDYPTSLKAKVVRLQCAMARMQVLDANDRFDEAMSLFDQEIILGNALVAEHPTFLNGKRARANIWQRKMPILYQRDQHEQFVNDARTYYEICEDLIESHTSLVYKERTRQFHAAILGMESTQLAHLERWDEAVEKAKQSLQVDRIVDGEVRLRYVAAATAMGRLVNIWEERVDVPGTAFDEACLTAINWLRLSVVEQGNKNRELFVTSPDFRIFQNYKEFQEVLELMSD